MEIFHNPKHSNKKNQMMYAVGVCVGKISLAKAFGLFSDNDGKDMHWEPIMESTWNFETDHAVSSVGSGDGRDVFFATHKNFNDSRIYRLTPSNGKVSRTSSFPSSLSKDGHHNIA